MTDVRPQHSYAVKIYLSKVFDLVVPWLCFSARLQEVHSAIRLADVPNDPIVQRRFLLCGGRDEKRTSLTRGRHAVRHHFRKPGDCAC